MNLPSSVVSKKTVPFTLQQFRDAMDSSVQNASIQYFLQYKLPEKTFDRFTSASFPERCCILSDTIAGEEFSLKEKKYFFEQPFFPPLRSRCIKDNTQTASLLKAMSLLSSMGQMVEENICPESIQNFLTVLQKSLGPITVETISLRSLQAFKLLSDESLTSSQKLSVCLTLACILQKNYEQYGFSNSKLAQTFAFELASLYCPSLAQYGQETFFTSINISSLADFASLYQEKSNASQIQMHLHELTTWERTEKNGGPEVDFFGDGQLIKENPDYYKNFSKPTFKKHLNQIRKIYDQSDERNKKILESHPSPLVQAISKTVRKPIPGAPEICQCDLEKVFKALRTTERLYWNYLVVKEFIFEYCWHLDRYEGVSSRLNHDRRIFLMVGFGGEALELWDEQQENNNPTKDYWLYESHHMLEGN